MDLYMRVLGWTLNADKVAGYRKQIADVPARGWFGPLEFGLVLLNVVAAYLAWRFTGQFLPHSLHPPLSLLGKPVVEKLSSPPIPSLKWRPVVE